MTEVKPTTVAVAAETNSVESEGSGFVGQDSLRPYTPRPKLVAATTKSAILEKKHVNTSRNRKKKKIK